MTIDDKIRDKKLQYDINREVPKISALSSGKIDKCEYLTGEETLPSNQRQIIEQAMLAYSPLGKTFEKQTKTIKDQREKQVEALEVFKPEENKEGTKSIEGLFPKEMRNDKIKNEIYEIKKWKNKIKRKDLKYETNKYVFDFQQFETIRSFGDSIYNGKSNIDEAEMKQTNLLENIMGFSNKSRPRTRNNRIKNKIVLII